MSEDKRTFTEEIQLKGSELVDKVKELIKEGKARKLIIKKVSGEVLFEVPLNAGVAVGSAVVLMAPVLAAIGAGAALLSDVRLEVQKINDSDEEQ
jgi:hypothetical protein